MAPRAADTEVYERLTRLEERQESLEGRHVEILTAIADSKSDIMLHIDERTRWQHRDCDMRHSDLERRISGDSESRKTSAQLRVQRFGIIAAFLGTVFASSTTAALVSHWLRKPTPVQVGMK